MDQSSPPPRRRQLAAARSRLDSARAAGHLSDAAHAAATQSVNGVQSAAELEGLLAYFERGTTEPDHLRASAAPSPAPSPGVAEVARPGRSLLPGRLLALGVLAICLISAGPRDTLDSVRGGIEAITDRIGAAGADPLTADGFEAWRERVVAETGSSEVLDATLHDTYAVATVVVPDDPGKARSYLFDGDWEALGDDAPRTSAPAMIDLADVDPQILDELIDSARTRLEIADPSETMVVFGTQVTTTSGTGQGTRTTSRGIVQVFLSSESRSGSVSTGLDGQPLDGGGVMP